MKIKVSELLESLRAEQLSILREAEVLRTTSKEALERKPAPERWSAAECLEHVNIGGAYYITGMERAMREDLHPKSVESYTEGRVGGFMVKALSPDAQGGIKAMKNPKSMDPRPMHLPHDIVEEFIGQQTAILQLIESSATRDLGKLTVPLTVAKFIRLRLGDVLRINVVHARRHLNQALRALQGK